LIGKPTRRAGDEHLRIAFFSDAIQDEAASAEAGRPVYREVDWVRIQVPSDPTADMQSWEETFVMNDRYKERFAQEYAEFKRQKAEPTSGTPLKMWPALNAAQVRELLDAGLKTVEELAEVSGKELRLNEWLKPHVEKAQVWIKSLTDSEVLLKLEAKVQSLERDNEELKQDNAELLAELQTLRDAKAKKRAKQVERTEDQ
jgi:hypothetical protein